MPKHNKAVAEEAKWPNPFKRAHSQVPALMINAVKTTKKIASEAMTAGTNRASRTTAVNTRCLSIGERLAP
jgi:hypothetical protein